MERSTVEPEPDAEEISPDKIRERDQDVAHLL
jgi:hypothetical protein